MKNMKKKINRKKKKKKEDEVRLWDALPNLALFNIFRNLHFKDRFGSIPLVCKAWNSVFSDDPRCYSSMIPDSISPDEAFIKKPVYSIQLVDLPSTLLYHHGRRLRRRDHHRQVVSRDPGVSYLRNFIKKSCSLGSSSSTITSLCLDPFHFSYRVNEWVDHDEILHLIAHCCPNLKHISFNGFYSASIKAVLEVFRRCKKIELIDFSASGYADSVQVIKELVNCLPNLRGIRMVGLKYYISYAIDYIATHFPWIELHYEKLECYICDNFFPVLDHECLCRVCGNRPRFQPIHRPVCYQCWQRVEEEEREAAAEAAYEDYWEYLRDLEEYDQYYVRVVLRTRMRKKNKKQLEAASSFMMKMKMRKKTDTYEFQDFFFM